MNPTRTPTRPHGSNGSGAVTCSEEVWSPVGPDTYSPHLTATLTRIHLIALLNRRLKTGSLYYDFFSVLITSLTSPIRRINPQSRGDRKVSDGKDLSSISCC
jgi:hypothetical protein